VIFGDEGAMWRGHSPPIATRLHTTMSMPTTHAAAAPGFQPVDWAQLTAHRDFLVRFARRRLQDPALAEDLVHDVFEAVVTGRAAFAGRSSLRSWLAAILKHKIVDLIRQRSGHSSLDASDGEDASDDGPLLALACPNPGPDEQLAQRQRLRQALQRISALPVGLRRAVELRLLHERSTEEVCAALDISSENLFVRLHRARRQLAS
jgi:RNA polymerase sigma-70 factor, ECF subfamily